MEGQTQMSNRRLEFALILSLLTILLVVVACGYFHAKLEDLAVVSKEDPSCKDIDWRYIECHLPENNCIVLDKLGDAMTCEDFFRQELIYQQQEEKDEQARTD